MMPWLGAARRSSRIPASAERELDDAESRAREAGARGDLEVVGIGMFGIVFCDDKGHAWKVGRLEKPSSDRAWIREALGEEYEWLRDAAGTAIAKDVAKVYGYHPEPVVLERECVPGSPGSWNEARKLSVLHKKIEDAMLPIGWTSPEFKEDSYVFRDADTAVLVDASMPHRVGDNLLGYVADVLEERHTTKYRWHDLAFFILREMHEKTVRRVDGLALLERLAVLDPEIRHHFSW